MAKKHAERKPEAARDLEEHAVYLGEEAGADVAVRFLQAADQGIRRLEEMPEIGARREFENVEVGHLRVWPIPDFPNHLIFYRSTEAGVEIVRVLHAKRDIPAILEEQ